MIPEEIEIGKVYRVFGTTLYLGKVEKFDGHRATLKMVTGRIIVVPWYNIVTVPNVTREHLEKPETAEVVYAEENIYLGITE